MILYKNFALSFALCVSLWHVPFVSEPIKLKFNIETGRRKGL